MTLPEARTPSCKLSIIVPTKDRADLLRRALTSISSQRANDVEVIIVDDGSHDDTRQVVSEFAAVTYHRNGISSGASVARNRGAALARGEWLLFLDDDDELKPDAIAAIVTDLSVQHDVCMFYLEQILTTGACRVPKHQLLHDHTDRNDLICQALRPISASQVVIRRALFERLGGFDEDLKTCNDIDLWTRALLADAEIGVIQRILATKHEHSEAQLTRNLPVAFSGHRAFLKKWRSPMRRRLSRTDYHKWYARRLNAIFHHHCAAGRTIAAPLPFSASVRYGAHWLKLAVLATPPVRAVARRRALVCALRTALPQRAYSAIASHPWMKRYTGGLGF
jgi:glycosyltransferase involved in cell wall biosynthesis